MGRKARSADLGAAAPAPRTERKRTRPRAAARENPTVVKQAGAPAFRPQTSGAGRRSGPELLAWMEEEIQKRAKETLEIRKLTVRDTDLLMFQYCEGADLAERAILLCGGGLEGDVARAQFRGWLAYMQAGFGNIEVNRALQEGQKSLRRKLKRVRPRPPTHHNLVVAQLWREADAAFRVWTWYRGRKRHRAARVVQRLARPWAARRRARCKAVARRRRERRHNAASAIALHWLNHRALRREREAAANALQRAWRRRCANELRRLGHTYAARCVQRAARAWLLRLRLRNARGRRRAHGRALAGLQRRWRGRRTAAAVSVQRAFRRHREGRLRREEQRQRRLQRVEQKREQARQRVQAAALQRRRAEQAAELRRRHAGRAIARWVLGRHRQREAAARALQRLARRRAGGLALLRWRVVRANRRVLAARTVARAVRHAGQRRRAASRLQLWWGRARPAAAAEESPETPPTPPRVAGLLRVRLDAAAILVQSAFRGHRVRQKYSLPPSGGPSAPSPVCSPKVQVPKVKRVPYDVTRVTDGADLLRNISRKAVNNNRKPKGKKKRPTRVAGAPLAFDALGDMEMDW